MVLNQSKHVQDDSYIYVMYHYDHINYQIFTYHLQLYELIQIPFYNATQYCLFVIQLLF